MARPPVAFCALLRLCIRPDRVTSPGPWAVPIYPGDVWCDDPAHASYNHLCRTPLPASHEQMRRADPQYDIVMITDWNWPKARPGAGSAIFLHQWRRPGAPTAGCVASGATGYALAGRAGSAGHAACGALIWA